MSGYGCARELSRINRVKVCHFLRWKVLTEEQIMVVVVGVSNSSLDMLRLRCLLDL